MIKTFANAFWHSSVRVLKSNSTNIHFNLAIEEYLFETAILSEPTLFLWRNDATIVIGRHQNPWKQCKNEEMKENGVKLSRRKTGGGAVYHDLGNTCFSFLTPYEQQQPYDYKTVNNQILISTFKELGVHAEVSGRNDITVENKKISGSAYRLHLGGKDGRGKKALHHGTVLFSVDLQALQKYLNPNKKKLQSKGINSVISRVMNLSQTYPNVKHQTFCEEVEKQFSKKYSSQIHRELLDYQTLKKNNETINSNYQRLKSWEWLYGQCPQFKYSIEKKFDWGLIEVTFNVIDGFIKQCKIYSDCLLPDFITIANAQILKNIKYDRNGLLQFQQKLSKVIDPSLISMSEELTQWMISQL